MSNYQTFEPNDLADVFKALSNPHRLKIFLTLASCCQPGTRWDEEEERRCVGELGGASDLAPSTVSHHLKELRRAGLIRMQRRGQKVECWVDPETVAALAGVFQLDKSASPRRRVG
ncbi:MAG: metalloregulator ArsR/SmtB family transcription factor [Alphaproteobacteria bacterium]|jgi:ArsR family transcriptional regulator|nr:metalloregulator ArsR/SmtB family transcription factor [Alphaproteobacteria bacterium]|tara:strand:- start:139 stop:486 length:348 start_codon:yes stop_codon:yes gene_type:complete